MSFGYQVLGFGSGETTIGKYVNAVGPDGAAGTVDGDYKYHTFTATKTGSNGFTVKST